ncbi:inositol monophosphatase family protein [Eupransor demetentiae]|uniref:Inositol monophosphatase family (SuhB) n=1 Tax=Eupransor demetentiae TaxID=3109584 RepID=A0ABP0EQF5_9LACO|nr:6-bisphosphatase or related enzyme [Lactobacillaceae bacterium LMG 33000]
MDVKEIDQTVSAWLEELGEHTRGLIHEHLTVKTKEGNERNLVTNVDVANQKWLLAKIQSLDPNARVIHEEGDSNRPTSTDGDIWYIDPIDGTMNFVHEHVDFAIMMALYRDGKPVLGWILDVMNQRLVHGGPEYGAWVDDQRLESPEDVNLEHAVMLLSGRRLVAGYPGYREVADRALAFRVLGSSGISFSRVILGQASGYYSKLEPWDFAPGTAIAAALNLAVTNLDGQPLNMLLSNSVLIATQSAHRDLIKMFKD